jgi:hypothetical protein
MVLFEEVIRAMFYLMVVLLASPFVLAGWLLHNVLSPTTSVILSGFQAILDYISGENTGA